MIYKKWTPLIIFSILLFIGCEKENLLEEGDFFYLKSEGAVMPVWVKGNKTSNKFIILLHGGPDGGSSQYYTVFPSHKNIEREFAIVYWDQRMCGMSQGKTSMKNATLEQFTTDLDKLVTLLNYKYKNPKLYLMGHSWGGALGTNYLLSHQSKINAWIEIDGAHSWTTANSISRKIMIDYAKCQIAKQKNIKYWEFALKWYEEREVVGINEDAHYTFVGRANGYDYNPESDSLQIPFTDLLFHSPISTAYYFAPYNFSFLNNGLDLQDELNKITIPTLICWGKHDKVFPLEIAYDTYSKLGTDESDKYIKIFEVSAHSPNYEEPKAFSAEVIQFVNKY